MDFPEFADPRLEHGETDAARREAQGVEAFTQVVRTIPEAAGLGAFRFMVSTSPKHTRECLALAGFAFFFAAFFGWIGHAAGGVAALQQRWDGRSWLVVSLAVVAACCALGGAWLVALTWLDRSIRGFFCENGYFRIHGRHHAIVRWSDIARVTERFWLEGSGAGGLMVEMGGDRVLGGGVAGKLLSKSLKDGFETQRRMHTLEIRMKDGSALDLGFATSQERIAAELHAASERVGFEWMTIDTTGSIG